jgi:hypothetical protein
MITRPDTKVRERSEFCRDETVEDIIVEEGNWTLTRFFPIVL